MVWFQFMLIWIANLPSTSIWYLPRSRGGWQWVAWALFVFHFAVPFFLLLLRDGQARTRDAGRGRRPDAVHAAGVHLLPGAAGLPGRRVWPSTGWTS